MKIEILEERLKNFIEENGQQHQQILDQIECIQKKLDSKYVSLERFAPIEKLVYSLAGLMLGAIVLGLVGLLLGKI